MAESLTVRMALDTRDYVAGASKAAKATDQITGSAQGGAAQQAALSKSTVGSVASFAKLAAGSYAVAKGLQFAGDAIASYSNLEESINAVNVQFGDGADAIKAFGETAATEVGLANSEFNQLSVTTGAIFATFIDDEQQVADETIKLTQRAADLASVFNTDVDEALLAVQASLRGEQEPIRRFGVSMDDLSVKAKAVELGLADSTGEVTQQAKQMARLKIIYEQTAKVQGDFANTADSLANSQKTLSARFEDAKAKIGESLAPVMAALVSASEDLIPALEELAPAIEDVSASLGDMIKRAAEAAPAITGLIKVINKLGGFKPAGAPIFESLGLQSFLPVTGALGLFVSAFGAVEDRVGSSTVNIRDNVDAIDALASRYPDAADAILMAAEATDMLNEGFVQQTPEARAAAFELAATERAARASGVAAYEAALEQGRFERSLKSKEAFAKWESEVSAAAAEAEANLRSSMASIISLFDKVPDQIKTSVEEAVANIRGQRELAEEFETNMRILGDLGFTALVGELEKAGPAANDLAGELVEDFPAALEMEEDIRAIMGHNVDGIESQAFLDRARALGMSVGEAWAAGFNLSAIGIPSIGSTRRPSDIDAGRDPSPGYPVPRATGGPAAAGTPYLVGERGPELWVPDTSGQVIPAGQFSQATTSNTVQVYVDGGGGDVADKTALGLLMAQITEEIEWAGTSTIR